MIGINQIIGNWDDSIADEWFAENMDLDQPREERIAELQKLTSGKTLWKPVVDSLTAPTKTFAKWRVESGGSTIEVELLMSPHKSPKIQHLNFKSTV